jgi:hypothetical protein
VVLVKERSAQCVDPRAGIEVVGDASRSAGVAGDEIAMQRASSGCTRGVKGATAWEKRRRTIRCVLCPSVIVNRDTACLRP